MMGLWATALATCAVLQASCIDEPIDAEERALGDDDDDALEVAAAQPRAARLREALAIAAMRSSEAATEAQILDLIDEADDYSEAALLARVAGGAFAGAVPPIPQEFIDEIGPGAADVYVFESWNVIHSEAVSERLRLLREARDAWLETLSDADFAAYASQAETEHEGRRRDLALELGRAFDARPDIAVVEASDGSIWRRKQVIATLTNAAPRGGEPGGGPLSQEDLELAQLGEPDILLSPPPGAVKLSAKPLGPVRQINGSDQRDLRSAFNGHTLASSVWGPQMLLTGVNADVDPPNGVPIDVRCSGTKISERIVASVGHCLFRDGAWNDTRRLVPIADGIADSQLGTDPSPEGTTTSQNRHVRSTWFDHEWANHDFGVLVLFDTSAFRCWWWHGWQENTSGLTQDNVFIYGYPGEGQPCAASPRGDGACWGSLYGAGGSVQTEGAYRFHYYIDTQPGQSGAGVYKTSASGRSLVGSHRGEYGCCMNDASRFNGNNTDVIQGAQADNPATPC
ncbi:trypsin-like serine peptidase [Nannocystis exedens]|nr:hypothetical protein [Nannocystis exedens]